MTYIYMCIQCQVHVENQNGDLWLAHMPTLKVQLHNPCSDLFIITPPNLIIYIDFSKVLVQLVYFNEMLRRKLFEIPFKSILV